MITIYIRAKMKVIKITQNSGDSDYVELMTVYDGSEENRKFYAATPGGGAQLTSVWPAVSGLFKVDQEFYVDLTPVDIPAEIA